MKKLLSFVLALLMILSCLPTLADGAQTTAEGMPNEVRAYFSAASFDGYTIDACLTMPDTPGGDYFFAVTQKNGHNVLHGFKEKDGAYTHFLRTDSAIPQGAGIFRLYISDGNLHLLSDQTLKMNSALSILFTLADNEEQAYSFEAFEVSSAGVWSLKLLCCDYTWREVLVGKDKLTYYAEGEKEGTAYGTLQTDLRYFSYSAFPKSLAEARKKLSLPPEIPASSQLKAVNVKFTGGQKYAVYTGPGEKFLRAGDGKAAVSTNDWIQVFGTEDNWAMIQYDITSDHLRIGWIPASALPKGAGVGGVNFLDQSVTVLCDTEMTDDPLKSRSFLYSLSEGQTVTLLAATGDWAYVQDEDHWVRGFVPINDVSYESAPSQRSSQAYVGENYSARAAVTLWDEGAAQVTVTVSAPASWLDDPEILYYQVYANNLYQDIAETIGGEEESGFAALTYQADIVLPDGASLLGLCPVYEDGVRAREAVTVYVGR